MYCIEILSIECTILYYIFKKNVQYVYYIFLFENLYLYYISKNSEWPLCIYGWIKLFMKFYYLLPYMVGSSTFYFTWSDKNLPYIIELSSSIYARIIFYHLWSDQIIHEVLLDI